MNNMFKAKTRKAVGMALFRGLNVISLISLVFYTSLVGVAIAPRQASADVGTITLNNLVDLGGGQFQATGTWEPQGNQCYTGNDFHYQVSITDNGTPVSPNPIVNPAACNGDFTAPVNQDDRALGGNWPAVGQPDAVFSLTPGSHTICAALIHVNPNGNDTVAASSCLPQDIIIPPAEGSVTVHKAFDSDGNGTFEGNDAEATNFSWGLDAETPARAMGSTVTAVAAGPHTISESLAPGYTFIGWYTGGDGTSNICAEAKFGNNQLPVNINVVSGETTEITLCNVRDTGTVTLEKIVSGGQSVPADWTFTVEGQEYHSGDQITLPTGTYPISESGPSGYTLTNVSGACYDDGGTFLVIGGDNSTCTFTNTYIPTPPNVSISKTDSDETANPGETQHYVITVTNSGEETAYGVEVTDTLPAEIVSGSVTNITPTPSTQTPTSITWSGLTILSGESITLEFDATLQASFAEGETVVTNTATLSCGYPPESTTQALAIQGCLYEGLATDTTSVTVAPPRPTTGDISGLKFNDLNANGSRDAGEPGLANWKIQLWTTCDIAKADFNNDGNVTLSDAVLFTTPYLSGHLNADIHIDSGVNPIDFQCMNALVNLMPSDGTWVVIAEQTTDANGNYIFTGLTPGDYRVSEVMQAGWSQTLPGTPNYFYATNVASNQSVVALDFGNATDPGLSISKTDNQTTATPGQVLTYQVAVTNSGASTATNVKVTDTLPSFITTVNAISDGGSQVGTVINWSNLTIAGNSTKILTYNVTVDPNLGSGSYVIHNVATLGCGSPITAIALVPCVYGGTAIDDTAVTVAATPILAIEKSANVSVANPGNTIVYTVKVSNTGTAAATNVILTDILPTGFTTLDSGANTLVVNLGTIAAGANVTTTYQTVSSTTLPSGVYTNVVTASATNAASVSTSADVTLLVPEVLGIETPEPEVLGAESLPETGTGMIDYVVALFGIMALGFGLRLTRPIKQ
jgi:uncharacterized repeat protein (TIGR01451 family)